MIKGLVLSALAGVVLVVAGGVNAAATAQNAVFKPGTQQLTYEVYAGGVNAVAATLQVYAPADSEYKLSFSAGTKGFLRALAPWDGTFETHGWQLKDGVRPELHRSSAIWREEEEVKEYSYNKKGDFVGYTVRDPESTVERDLPPAELTQGTIDVLTATLDVMQDIAAGQSCDSSSEVFDGKRRFAMKFRLEGEEQLNASRYNVYGGPSQRCVVEVTPVAGEWHKKPRGWMSIQEQGRMKGKLPTVWFAKVSPDKPAVPVKVRVTSEYGTMFMHLVGYTDGATTLAQAQD